MLSLAPHQPRPPGPNRTAAAPAVGLEDVTGARLIGAPEARRLPGGQAHWITSGAGLASPLLRRAW